MGTYRLDVKMIPEWWIILLCLTFAMIIVLVSCIFLKISCDRKRKNVINSESSKCDIASTETNSSRIRTESKDSVSTVVDINSVKSEISTLKERLSELEGQMSGASDNSFWNSEQNLDYAEIQYKDGKEDTELEELSIIYSKPLKKEEREDLRTVL